MDPLSRSDSVKLVDRSAFSINPPRAVNHLHSSKVNCLSSNALTQLNDKRNSLEKMDSLTLPRSDPVKLVDQSSFSINPPRTVDHLHNSKMNCLSSNALSQLNDKNNLLAFENLELPASSSLLPKSTKLVNRTSTSVKPPRALIQHNKRPIASNMDQVNGFNCAKEPVLSGGVKLSEKLIDRSVRIDKSATIRKPNFSSLKKFEKKVNDDVNNWNKGCNAEKSVDSEFKPLLTSTSENVADQLKNANSMANESFFNDSMEPGQKTLLLDECLLKTNYTPAVKKEDLVISSECDNIFKRQALILKSDGNNNIVLKKLKEPERMDYSSSTGISPRKKDVKPLRNAKDLTVIDDNSFHTFLQVDLTAKCQVCFEGNEKMKMKFPIGIAELLNGKIVVADTFNDRMLLFNNDATFIKEFNGSKRLSQPSAIDVLTNGNFAVRDNHSIVTFSEECHPLKTLGNNFLSKPYGITHDNDGNIITIDVSANGSFTVVKIDPISGMLVSRVTANLEPHSPDNKLSKPRFITFRDPNELLVVDLGRDLVYILKMDTGNLISKFGGHGSAPGKFNDPSGIACDAEGYMFIGDSRNHRIQVFTPEGKFACILKVDRALKRPSGLHLTTAGHLYVLNYWENSFVKYAFSVDTAKGN